MPFSYHLLGVLIQLELCNLGFFSCFTLLCWRHTHTCCRLSVWTEQCASFLTSVQMTTHCHPSLLIFASLCSSGCTLTGYGAHAGLELKVIPLAQTPKVWGHQCTSGALGHLPGYLRALPWNPPHRELVLLSHLWLSFFPLPHIRAGSKSSCFMLTPLSLHSSFLPSIKGT